MEKQHLTRDNFSLYQMSDENCFFIPSVRARSARLLSRWWWISYGNDQKLLKNKIAQNSYDHKIVILESYTSSYTEG